jgi:hypothetical protein
VRSGTPEVHIRKLGQAEAIGKLRHRLSQILAIGHAVETLYELLKN